MLCGSGAVGGGEDEAGKMALESSSSAEAEQRSAAARLHRLIEWSPSPMQPLRELSSALSVSLVEHCHISLPFGLAGAISVLTSSLI